MVVAVTGYAMKEDQERCLASGFDAYMTKPLDRASFLKVVHDYLDDSLQ
jgi:CheY-like chemotaxis protein